MACRSVMTPGDDPAPGAGTADHGEGEGRRSRRGSGKCGGGILSGRARPLVASLGSWERDLSPVCPSAGVAAVTADTPTANMIAARLPCGMVRPSCGGGLVATQDEHRRPREVRQSSAKP
jgi:hypothetical protein